MNTVAPRYLHTGTSNFFARRAVPGRTLNSPTRLRTRFQWLADLQAGDRGDVTGLRGARTTAAAFGLMDGCTSTFSARPQPAADKIVHADAIALPADRSIGYLLALRNAFSRLQSAQTRPTYLRTWATDPAGAVVGRSRKERRCTTASHRAEPANLHRPLRPVSMLPPWTWQTLANLLGGVLPALHRAPRDHVTFTGTRRRRPQPPCYQPASHSYSELGSRLLD